MNLHHADISSLHLVLGASSRVPSRNVSISDSRQTMLNRLYISTISRLPLCLIFALCLLVFGCSGTQRPSVRTNTPEFEQPPRLSLRTLTIPGVDLPRYTNPELLELDDSRFKNISKELRALIVALAWMEKSEEQSSIDTTASFTSALRAAQITLDVLLHSNGCKDRASLECDTLSAINRRATHYIIDTLRARSWTPPSMSPGRYNFSETSNRNITLLRNWETIIPDTPDQLHIDRPGLGVPFYGCRPFKKHARVCSPFTAVLSFLDPLSKDTIRAELSIVDSYQQEVLSIGDVHIPLTANFTTPIKDLVADSTQSSFTLRCLSTPTSSTGVLLLLQQSKQLSGELEGFLESVALNPLVRDSYTPCLASVGDTVSIQSTAKLSKRVSRALQSVLRDSFSTKENRLAIMNITPETIQFSTLLTTTLSTTKPPTWQIVTIGIPPAVSALRHHYAALEDTAARFSVKPFTLQKTCESACQHALTSEDYYSTDPSRGSGRSPATPHPFQEDVLPEGSFTVSPAM